MEDVAHAAICRVVRKYSLGNTVTDQAQSASELFRRGRDIYSLCRDFLNDTQRLMITSQTGRVSFLHISVTEEK